MSNEPWQTAIAKMRDTFREKLPNRLNEIELALTDARVADISGMSNALDKCHSLVHKLAGAAGTFGYPSISKEARKLEIRISELLKTDGQPDADKWRVLDEYMYRLKDSFIGRAAEETFVPTDWRVSAGDYGPDIKTETTLIVVDDDIQTTDALRLQLSHFGYKVVVSNDMTELPGLLEVEAPAALILDISFPGDPMAGINMAKTLRSERKLNCPLLFISVREDLEVKLEAVRAEADAYFPKPIVLTDLMNSLDQLINPDKEDAFRVVVVDDDPEVANFNAAALNEAGIVTVVVTDPMKVMPPVRELRPDLILMDIQMPGCSGFELARTIRFDKSYVQTPIVFLTGSDITDTWLNFVKSGGDELLRKTISTRELVAIVHARCKRSRELLSTLTDLKMSEARFRSVAQTAQEAIVTSDQENRIVFWNPAAEELFGYSPEQIVGQNSDILFAEEKFQGGASWSGLSESTILRQDAKSVPVELSVSEWAVNDNAFVTRIIRNITEQKDAQNQMILARDEAERANRAKSEFLSAMSHDLRTPLNSILGFVSLMLSDPTTTLNEDQIESLSYIRNGGTHLLELINQVLDLSAVETGNINLHTENIKIAELVDDCLGLIRVTADQRDIRMEAVSESANTIALADRQRLKEILLNLLSNAVKYNTVGGSITVRTVCPDDDLIRITVEDTGPGIPEENLDRLFVPFDRLGANASEVEGTGIGLTIAKRFVEHMGGAIGVSSVVGEGSRFWLDLPRAPAAGTVDAVDRSEEDLFSGPPSGVARDRVTTVLCIEDNVANMRLLKRIFATRPEFLMIEESTGEDGLKRAELERPDIILMDIGLPGMDGYETLKALQASPDCKDIPVIALSANAMSHDLDRGLAAGFFNYLTKPVVITDLVRCLKEAAAS